MNTILNKLAYIAGLILDMVLGYNLASPVELTVKNNPYHVRYL